MPLLLPATDLQDQHLHCFQLLADLVERLEAGDSFTYHLVHAPACPATSGSSMDGVADESSWRGSTRDSSTCGSETRPYNNKVSGSAQPRPAPGRTQPPPQAQQGGSSGSSSSSRVVFPASAAAAGSSAYGAAVATGTPGGWAAVPSPVDLEAFPPLGSAAVPAKAAGPKKAAGRVVFPK